MMEEREKLLDDIVKMLVDYDNYVLEKHRLEIEAHTNLTKGTPFAPKQKPLDEPLHYWKYRTNPMINRIANSLVGYILNNKDKR